MGDNLAVGHALAAHVVQRLTRAARQTYLRMPVDELLQAFTAKEAADMTAEEVKSERIRSGIAMVIAHLGRHFGQFKPVRKETLNDFG